ncbi:unnamed protein product [Vicia faba]|uniref:Reverse transcriptase zinc-binding domain-containing protein n=1 Tax=Vicia faba TaxID=3906 RepID=A0AAV0ZCS7_VICFA|nr:unnamed protein product [Vicia faba]
MFTVIENSSWCLGNGSSINLLFDNWCGQPLYVHRDSLRSFEDHPSDKRCWKNSADGDLTLNIAYDFKRHRGNMDAKWSLIWNKLIPPSKSFLAWRLFHHKMPTDDHWKNKSFSFPSRCSLCGRSEKMKTHLLFYCDYAHKLWSWLKNMLNISSSSLGWDVLWKILNSDGATQY